MISRFTAYAAGADGIGAAGAGVTGATGVAGAGSPSVICRKRDMEKRGKEIPALTVRTHAFKNKRFLLCYVSFLS